MAYVRLFIVLAAFQQWPLYQLDVKNAFLNEDLQEEIYIEQPLGFFLLRGGLLDWYVVFAILIWIQAVS